MIGKTRKWSNLLLAVLVLLKKCGLELLTCRSADLVDSTKAHAARIVHLDIKAYGLKRRGSHAANVLNKLVRGYRLGACLLHHKALGRRACHTVCGSKGHSKGLANAGNNSHVNSSFARIFQRRNLLSSYARSFRADNAYCRSSLHNARSANGNCLTWLNINRTKSSQELVRLIERPNFKQVILANRCVCNKINICLLVAAQLNTATIQTTFTLKSVLKRTSSGDLSNNLTTVVGALVAHHLVASGTMQVSVSQATVKRAFKQAVAACHISLIVHALLGSINCLTIRRHHRVHVLRCLHAALNLKRTHARLNHVRHIINGAIILGTEQSINAAHRNNFVLRIEQLIRQATRLSTGSTVSRAISSHRRHVTDARIAETQGSVTKTFQLNAKLGNGRNFFFRKLSGQRNATHTKLFAGSNTARIVDICLC